MSALWTKGKHRNHNRTRFYQCLLCYNSSDLTELRPDELHRIWTLFNFHLWSSGMPFVLMSLYSSQVCDEITWWHKAWICSIRWVQGSVSGLTQEVFVRAEFGRVQKELDENVGGHNQNQTDTQQSRDHAVEEQPAEWRRRCTLIISYLLCTLSQYSTRVNKTEYTQYHTVTGTVWYCVMIRRLLRTPTLWLWMKLLQHWNISQVWLQMKISEQKFASCLWLTWLFFDYLRLLLVCVHSSRYISVCCVLLRAQTDTGPLDNRTCNNEHGFIYKHGAM